MASVHVVTYSNLDMSEENETFDCVFGNETKAVEYCKRQLTEYLSDDGYEDDPNYELQVRRERSKIRVVIYSKRHENDQEWYDIRLKMVQ